MFGTQTFWKTFANITYLQFPLPHRGDQSQRRCAYSQIWICRTSKTHSCLSSTVRRSGSRVNLHKISSLDLTITLWFQRHSACRHRPRPKCSARQRTQYEASRQHNRSDLLPSFTPTPSSSSTWRLRSHSTTDLGADYVTP